MEFEVTRTRSAVDILTEARNYIAQLGKWKKNTFGRVNGPVCAIGSLRHVITGDPHKEDGEAEKVLTGLLNKCVPKKFQKHSWKVTIIDFNDAKKTTQEDVVRVFDRAIRAAKKL